MKLLSPQDWKHIVRPGSRIFIAGGAAVPFALVDSLLEQSSSFIDVEMTHIHGLGPTPWIDKAYASKIRTNSFFLTPSLRAAVERGQADYTPCAMSEIPGLFQRRILPLDVALIQVAPADAQGRFSLGVSVDVVLAAARAARIVVAQINPTMPRTSGNCWLTASHIDYFIDHKQTLPVAVKNSLDDRHRAIGRYAAQLIEDGSTLQVGLGNSPEAVIRALKQHRHLGIHTGMFCDALMELVLCGAVDHSQKSIAKGKIIASHAIGSRKLYQYLDGNAEIEMHPSDWVNDPQRIARNHRMVAINGARQIDLTGQVVRDSNGHRFYGGVGALQDFIRGAGHSKGGRPIIALTSTGDDDGASRIVAGLDAGSGVCTSRGDVHHVVTEYGAAHLYGCSIRERVARLVEIAHPDHRESLLAGAHARGWLPKFFSMPPHASKKTSNPIESRLYTFSGKPFLLRPLHPSDMRLLQEFFYSHDEETIRMRYGYHRHQMSGESAYKLAAVDQTKDVALGLFSDVNGRQVLRAVGRYYLDADQSSAEVAFVVHQDCRNLGMGKFLLVELARIARMRKIREFWATVIPDNKVMATLFVKAGGKAQAHALDDEEIPYRIPIRGILSRQSSLLQGKQILEAS